MIINLKHNILEHGKQYLTSGYRIPSRPDHTGTDWISKHGGTQADTVVTPFPGKVIGTRNTVPGYDRAKATGNHVYIDLGNGYTQRMYHLEKGSLKVRVNQNVKAGQVVATMGHTGYCIPANAAGTHLHYELRKNDVPIDPMPYLMGEKTFESDPSSAPVTPKKSNAEVAEEIYRGKNNWGNGNVRIAKLKAAGYDPTAVQKLVNELVKKPATPATRIITPTHYMVLVSRLDVRKKPEAGSTVVNSLPRGTVVTVTQTVGTWGKIGTNRWININSAYAGKAATYRIIVPYLNIRSGPSTGYADIGDVTKNKEVEVFAVKGNWGQIEKAKWAPRAPRAATAAWIGIGAKYATKIK